MAKKLKEEEAKQQKRDDKTNASSSSNNSKHEGGLELVDKIFEPLDTLLMAYESRLKLGDTLEIQWEKYRDPELEKCQFAICKHLIEVTQKLVEQQREKQNNQTKPQIEPQQPKTNKTLPP